MISDSLESSKNSIIFFNLLELYIYSIPSYVTSSCSVLLLYYSIYTKDVAWNFRECMNCLLYNNTQ